MEGLNHREIVLGVTGGIAAYKAVEVLRRLKGAGAEVSVVMTRSAREFVQPLTFQTLSNRPVATTLFDLDQESRIGHIRMAENADLVLVAPCTANLVAKLRAGIADDLLSTVLLATTAPVALALAMNDNMLHNPATQENLEVLRGRGVTLIPPEVGLLAEGKYAEGRLAAPERIVELVANHFSQTAPGALAGRRVLITAGPTVEAIDPVRFISNHSSGRMGYALAQACRDAGAAVTLVSGPTNLPEPQGLTLHRVKSAVEMETVVRTEEALQDVLIFAAAVSDYRAQNQHAQKIKRGNQPTLALVLEQNPDIAAGAGSRKRPGQVLVAFAAESQNLLENAQAKLVKKNADLVVANDITEPGSGFDSTQNRVMLLRKAQAGNPDPQPDHLPLMDKTEVARRIVQTIAALLEQTG